MRRPDAAPRPALASAELGATVTYQIAPAEVHVHPPPPRLVWIDSALDIIRTATGLERSAFVDLLRTMERDVDHGRHVLRVTRKRRGVEVDAFVAFLRARYTAPARAPAAPSADDDEDAAQAAFEREAGCVDVVRPAPPSAPRRTRAGRRA